MGAQAPAPVDDRVRTLTTLELAVEQHLDMRTLSFQHAALKVAVSEALKLLRQDAITPAERVLQQAIGEGK